MFPFHLQRGACWCSMSLLITIQLLICSPVEANSVQKCFVCNAKSSPKCQGPLTPSDSELIKECTHEGSSEDPVGCQVFALKSGPCVNPKVRHFWRDCLYPSDMNNYGIRYNNVTETTWASSRSIHYTEMLPEATARITEINRARVSNGNAPLPTYKLEGANSAAGWALYYHPLPETNYWNLSNGAAIQGLFQRNFYHTLEQESWQIPKGGCQNATSSSSPSAFYWNNKWAVPNVLMGCFILSNRF